MRKFHFIRFLFLMPISKNPFYSLQIFIRFFFEALRIICLLSKSPYNPHRQDFHLMYLHWGGPYNQIWRLILHLLRRSFPKNKWVFLRIPIYSAFIEADPIPNMKVDSAFIEADHIIKFEGWFCLYLRRTFLKNKWVFYEYPFNQHL